MHGIGVIEDGYTFTEEDIERGSPRFWWGPRKRAAYDRVLARRGMHRRDEDESDEGHGHDRHWDDDDRGRTVFAAGATAGAVHVATGSHDEEKKTESGSSWGSWFGGGGDSGSSDSGSSSDSGGSSDGGGGSSE